MTTLSSTVIETRQSATAGSRATLLAVVGAVLSALLTAIGTFWDITGNDESTGSSHDVRDYLVTLAAITVATIIVYALVVRRAAVGRPGRRSVILGVVAILSLAAFWAGLPIVLAGAAAAAAFAERDKLGGFGGGSKTGLTLAGLTTIAAVALAISG